MFRKEDDPKSQFAETYHQKLKAPPSAFAETYQDLNTPSAFAETYQELNAPLTASHLHTLKEKSGGDVEYHCYSFPDTQETMASIGMTCHQPSESQEGPANRIPDPNFKTLKHDADVVAYSQGNEIDDEGYFVPHQAFCRP